MAMEEAAYICGSDPIVIAANGQRCFHEGTVSEGTEKTNCVEEVGFSDAIRTGYAREWSEVDINIHKILEAGYL